MSATQTWLRPLTWRQVLENWQCRVKVRGFGPGRRFSFHQQTRFPEFFKEPIPAHLHTSSLQLRADQVVELPHPKRG